MASTIELKLKHAGKTYPVQVDLAAPATTFKAQIEELTGVPAAKQKTVVKGGQLKDDHNLKSLGLKAGQTLMVIGAAGELLKAPAQPMKFLEDLTDSELAKAAFTPGGLVNLGNTCYMNSTVQVLRAIPELQTALQGYTRPSDAHVQGSALSMTASLKSLYSELAHTTEGYQPLSFWSALRTHVPQFQEVRNNVPAQQDAEECWSAILTTLKATLEGQERGKHWVDQYMAGTMTTETKCVEAPDEAPTTSSEPFMELKCNISSEINFMINGIRESLDNDIEKNSPSLGRSAIYKSTSRVSRLPAYLTVHQVRFFWRREINKKAKIMRKVKFPFELDVSELVTDELKAKIQPVSVKLKEVDKDRRERAKVRRRTKLAAEDQSSSGGGGAQPMDVDPAPAASGSVTSKVDELSVRQKEKRELEALLDKDLAADVGANATGVYELMGVVSHKGASADGGHYIGWVKAGMFDQGKAPDAEKIDEDPDKEQWIKFDDDKVTYVPRTKVAALDGGGEDSLAYILLYRSLPLD